MSKLRKDREIVKISQQNLKYFLTYSMRGKKTDKNIYRDLCFTCVRVIVHIN